ncbi:hypothetical protein [Streptomyces sp. NPDC005141]
MNDPKTPADAFMASLSRLYKDAGSPPYTWLIKHGKGQDPPLTLSRQRLSEWLTGKQLPPDERTLRFLVELLEACAAKTGDHRMMRWPWWEHRWHAARRHREHERSNRARKHPGGLLDQPWRVSALEPRGGEMSTSVLLAKFEIVPYLFPEVTAEFATWCDSPEPLAVRYMEAPGGAGKTRYAITVCKAQAQAGWAAGFVELNDRRIDTARGDRLLVVDEFGGAKPEVLARRLQDVACSPQERVRVLLLARPAEYPERALRDLRQCFGEQARDDVWNALEQTQTVALPKLTTAARKRLFDAAVAAFSRGHRSNPTGTESADLGPLAEDPAAGPLDVLCAALDAVWTGPNSRRGTGAPLDRVLNHEFKMWGDGANGALSGHIPLLRRCVAMVTLTGGARTDDEAEAILTRLPGLTHQTILRDQVDRWLRGRNRDQESTGAGAYAPLRPDPLGEQLILHVCRGEEPRLLDMALDLPCDDQVTRTLGLLARLATDKVIAATVTNALTQDNGRRYLALLKRGEQQLKEILARQDRGLPFDGVTLLDELRRTGDLLLAERDDLREARDHLAQQLARFRIRKIHAELNFGTIHLYYDQLTPVIIRTRALRRALDQGDTFAELRSLQYVRRLVDRLDHDLRLHREYFPQRPTGGFLTGLTKPTGPNLPGDKMYFRYQVKQLERALDQMLRSGSATPGEPTVTVERDSAPSSAAVRMATAATWLLPAGIRPRVEQMQHAKLHDVADAGFPAYAQLYYATGWFFRALFGQLIWRMPPQPLDDPALAEEMGLNRDIVTKYRGEHPRSAPTEPCSSCKRP